MPMTKEVFVSLATRLVDKAATKGVKFLLLNDVIIAEEFKIDAPFRAVSVK